MRTLITWIGKSDLRAAKQQDSKREPGPILRLLQQESFDHIHFLNDLQPGGIGHEEASPDEYVAWIAEAAGLKLGSQDIHTAPANLHNDCGHAYAFSAQCLKQILDSSQPETQFGLLLSAGNFAAQAALLIVSQTLFAPGTAELFSTSRESGVTRVELPYDLSVDVVHGVFHGVAKRVWEGVPHKAFDQIIGQSKAIQIAMQLATTVAEFHESVLLRGETGTGKERFARAMHEASRRSEKPFVAINCAAVPSDLLESELFGHTQGAFTGATVERPGRIAAAEGGTLFLDEIGDMRADLQAKLLRFLQERKYTQLGSNEETSADVWVMAATHQDLQAAIAAGSFRSDLYYRLNTITISLPPLRERGDDVRLLAEYFLDDFNRRYETKKKLDSDALRALARRKWAGNCRELENAIKRLAILAGGDVVSGDDVELLIEPARPLPGSPLRSLTPTEFTTHFVAALDELIARFRQPRQLAWDFATDADLANDLLAPLILGRAVKRAGSFNAAGKLVQKSKFDESKDSIKKRRSAYEILQRAIDESLIAEIRGEPS